MARSASKFPVLRTKFPRIVDYRTASLGCFMVDGRRRGQGRREYFANLKEAKARADQIATERENHGVAALNFSINDRVMAAECAELLAPWGRSLREATLHFVAHLKRERDQAAVPLVRDCVAQFIAARERDAERGELATRSLVELRQCTTKLAASLGELRITELDGERLRAYLDAFPFAARTRSNLRLRLSGFFAFCCSKKWLTNNPCGEIKIKVPRTETVVLTVAAAEHLLRCAEVDSKRAATLVPYLALCLLGGLRPFEAQQLDWASVDFETNHLHVLPHTSKKREGRYVQMEPALVAWLLPYAKATGLIVSRNHRKQWDALIAAAGYSAKNPWPQDGMRHTAASMLLAVKRNRALVAEELGTSVDVLRRHYRQPIRKAEAERFWSLRPRAETSPSRTRLTAERGSASLAAVS